MAVAYKVAGNSSPHHHPRSRLEPLQKYYVIHGFWPRYRIGVVGDADFDGYIICWGKEQLKVEEITLRLRGFKRHKPRPAAK